jgi:hypothetical protein
MTNDKPLTHLERIKSVNGFAVKNNIPIKKVFDLYNKVNDLLYIVKKDNSLYNPSIEDITFSLVERYFGRLN